MALWTYLPLPLIKITTSQGGGINWETGTDIYTLIYIAHITNKNLLNNTENSSQNSIMTSLGIEHKKEWIHVCITDSLCW